MQHHESRILLRCETASTDPFLFQLSALFASHRDAHSFRHSGARDELYVLVIGPRDKVLGSISVVFDFGLP